MATTERQLPALGVMEIALSAACAASMRAAVQLGVPDAIEGEPISIDELAGKVEADPDALRRLMRALTCYGVFEEVADGCLVHTESSRLLRNDAPNSLKDLTLWLTDSWTWSLWNTLADSVRTGKGSFASLYGRDYFEQLHVGWPESGALFDRAMTQSSRLSALAIADMLPTAGVDTVADIAGGQGYVLATLLEHYPDMRGTLLDLPHVVANADPRLLPGGALADRVELIGADCRANMPVQADLYFFKNILGMGDADAVAAMRTTALSAGPGARIIIVENFVDRGPGQKFSTAADLRMLLTVGGRKHTREGLLALVGQAGLVVEDVLPVDSYQHMVVATVPRPNAASDRTPA